MAATLSWVALLGCGDPRFESDARDSLTSDEPNGPRSSVVLVTLDTMRADRLGSYGYSAALTPALDGLAARGTIFRQALTPSPQTLPAHSTLFTGLAPPEHGVRVNGEHRLAEDIPTLAERLRGEGFRTGAFIAAFVLDAKFGLDRGFEVYDDDLEGAYEQEVPEALSVYRRGDHVMDAALAWLESVAGPSEGEADPTSAPPSPFFAWIHLYDAHYPWHAHAELADTHLALQVSYDAEVALVDRQVARLLSALEKWGLREQTFVVAVGDHGEGLDDHGEIEHGYLLNAEVLRVPWIVAGPGVAAGQQVEALVSLEDFYPTLLALVGLDPPGGRRGRNLMPALKGEELAGRASYAETDLPWTSFRWSPQRSLTTERWKYVRTARPELYDRLSDSAELINLAHLRPRVVAELEDELAALEAEMQGRETLPASLGAAERQQLASLGYLQGGTGEAPADEAQSLADVKDMLPTKHLAARLRRGLAHGSLESEEIFSLAQQLVEQSPQTPSFHGHLGMALVNRGEVELGIAELAEAVRLDPGSASAHYDLGDILQQHDQPERSREHLEAALGLDPEFAPAHVGMGNVFAAKSQLDLAAGHYAEALRLRPGYAEAHFNLADTFARRGFAQLALEHYGEAIGSKPNWALGHYTLANLLLELGRFDQAAAHYEAVLALEPNDADAHNNLGVTLAARGQREEAMGHYREALRLAPEFYRPYINLGDGDREAGEYARARGHYEEAVALRPNLAEPASRLARLLATCPDTDQRDGTRAILLAERAAGLTQRRDATVLDTLAAAYAEAGRFEDAVATAGRAQQRAELEGLLPLASAIAERRALYARSQRYHEPAAP